MFFSKAEGLSPGCTAICSLLNYLEPMQNLVFIFLLIAATSYSKPIEKKVWLENFSKSFLEDFCTSEQIQFCYEPIKPSCKEVAMNKIRVCAQKIKIPNAINLGPEGGLLGGDIGRCVSRELSPDLKKKNSEDAKCKNIF
jgi:hypothetical protein